MTLPTQGFFIRKAIEFSVILGVFTEMGWIESALMDHSIDSYYDHLDYLADDSYRNPKSAYTQPHSGVVRGDVKEISTWVDPHREQAISLGRQAWSVNEKSGFDLDSDDGLNDKKWVYGCFPVKKKQRRVCFLSLSVVLIILGAIFFFFWPRVPDITVVDLYLANGASSFTFDPPRGAANSFRVTLDMVLVLEAFNTNYYNLQVDSINVDVFVSANKTAMNKGPGGSIISPGTTPRRIFTEIDTTVRIGGSQHQEPILFPSKETKRLLMDLQVIYEPDDTYDLKDDVLFNELMQSCGIIEPSKNRTMKIHYIATAPLKFLANLGYVPTITNDLNINCPLKRDAIMQIVDSVKGKIDSVAHSNNNNVQPKQLPPTVVGHVSSDRKVKEKEKENTPSVVQQSPLTTTIALPKPTVVVTPNFVSQVELKAKS